MCQVAWGWGCSLSQCHPPAPPPTTGAPSCLSPTALPAPLRSPVWKFCSLAGSFKRKPFFIYSVKKENRSPAYSILSLIWDQPSSLSAAFTGAGWGRPGRNTVGSPWVTRLSPDRTKLPTRTPGPARGSLCAAANRVGAHLSTTY